MVHGVVRNSKGLDSSGKTFPSIFASTLISLWIPKLCASCYRRSWCLSLITIPTSMVISCCSAISDAGLDADPSTAKAFTRMDWTSRWYSEVSRISCTSDCDASAVRDTVTSTGARRFCNKREERRREVRETRLPCVVALAPQPHVSVCGTHPESKICSKVGSRRSIKTCVLALYTSLCLVCSPT